MSWKLKSDSRDYIVWLGLLAIGTGSFLFHSTLKYEWQLSDELPMLYASSAQIYSLINLFNDNYSNLSVILLSLYCIIITIIYEYSRLPIIFQCAYVVLVIFLIFYPIYPLRILSIKNPKHRKKLFDIYFWSLATYLLGSVFWILDNNYCDQLRIWRSSQPVYLAPFGQFHCYWHILSGIGGYGACVLVIYLRQLALKRNVKAVFGIGIYPFLFLINETEKNE